MAEMTTKTPSKKTGTKTTPESAKTTAAKAVAAKPAAASTKPAAAKPAAKTAAVKKPAAAKAVATKPAAKKANSGMIVSDEQRYRMVAEAAYYHAESNQFKSDPVRDWIAAESDIAALLSGSK